MTRTTEIERGVLGALTLQPALLEDSDLQDADFSPGRFRETFSAISDLWETDRPTTIDTVVLAERIGGSDPVTFITALVDGQIRIDPDAFRRRVTELRKGALTARILAKIERQAKAGDLDLEEVRSDLEQYEGLNETGRRVERHLWEQGRTFGELRQLDLRVEWLVDRLIPLRAITQIHAKTGTGKTWIGLELVKALVSGSPFFGIPTRRTEKILYADYEMPLDLMKERADALDLHDGRLWNIADTPPPPRLDSSGWKIFLQAEPGSVNIFDSLRSAFSLKGNDDDVACEVMTRTRQVRDRGGAVVMFHHTGWADERRSKGNTAWVDLADCVLSLHRVRPKTFEAVEDDDDDPDPLYYFGTGEKSRYARFHIYLRRSPSGSLVRAEDPAEAVLDQIAEVMGGSSFSMNQGQIIEECGKAGVGPKKRGDLVQLLNRGERDVRWTTHKGLKNAKFYDLEKEKK